MAPDDDVRISLTPLGEAVVALERQDKRRYRRPLTRADLEQIAEDWNIRIDDLWPALDVAQESEMLDEIA